MAGAFDYSLESAVSNPPNVLKWKLSEPDSLVYSNGIYYILNGATKNIELLSSSGEILNEISQFSYPWGISISLEYLFVSDVMRNDIQIFTLSGIYVKSLGKLGNSIGEFDNPAGIFYSEVAKKLFVADCYNNRIQVSTGEFKFNNTIGDKLVCFPKDVCLNSSLQVVILDESPKCLKIFNLAGDLMIQFATLGKEIGNPWSISVCHSHIFITDDEIPGFLVYTEEGNCVGRYGSIGDKPGDFATNSPTGIYFNNEENSIFICDKYNDRIQVFHLSSFNFPLSLTEKF